MHGYIHTTFDDWVIEAYGEEVSARIWRDADLQATGLHDRPVYDAKCPYADRNFYK